MVRPLSTYLLLIMTCSFFLMSVNAMHLDNFNIVQSNEKVAPAAMDASDNCFFMNSKEHTLPINQTPLIENFDFENEVEVEIDVLPTVGFVPSYFKINYLQNLFLNAFTTYSFTVFKVEFLDIFSPPPNC
jgi:hypothetical protein